MTTFFQDLRYALRTLTKSPGFTVVAAAGIAAGLAAAFVLTRLLAGLLFGVSAADPVSFGSAAGILLLAALAVGDYTARRASHADSAQAFVRNEQFGIRRLP